MKLKFFFLTTLFLITCSVATPQYTLQQAFPNLSIFQYPVELVNAGDGSNRLFLVQQGGQIFVFNSSPTVSTKKTFIDISNKIAITFETGLFGLAFHPNYKVNRYFYVHYIFDSAGSPTGKWIRVSRFTASLSNPDTALSNTEYYLLKTPLLGGTLHNGGKLAFGPDGYLYISFGDGYTNGFPSQDLTYLLGKILRINVDSTASGKQYAIPPTNPFYQNNLGYKEEVYAYGMRNVWKFSIDFPTNRIFAGDVGESAYEEIDLIESGKNYGWNKMEGFHCYGVCDTAGRNFTMPIWEHPHPDSRSITAGYVYRGALLPEFYEKFIYGDFQNGNIWALTYDGINPTSSSLIMGSTHRITSFGLDESKEIYVVSYFNGTILKIVNSNIAILKLKTAIEGFYNPVSNRHIIRDTVDVILHSALSPYNAVDSSTTVIDSVSLEGLCFFKNAQTGKYYFEAKHRNALQTWSRNGGDSIRKAYIMNYDFTSDASMAYGNNLVQKGTKYCFYSGDVNQDGIIDITDNQLIDNDNYFYSSGYLSTDLNGDGFIDVSDATLADNNSFNNVIVVHP